MTTETKCTEHLSESLKFLKPLESEWHSLGVHLKIEKSTLKNIEADHKEKGVQRCLTEVISHWQQNEEDPSWEKIANAVENVGGYKNVVTAIHNKFLPSMASTIASAKDLESGYGSSASHSASDSEQDLFDTPLSPGCGCGECNIHKLCTEHCPRPDYTKRLPIITKFDRNTKGENISEIPGKILAEIRSPTSHDHHCSVDAFEANTLNIRKCFGSLVRKTCDSLEEHAKKDSVALYLLNSFPLLSKKADEIDRAHDMTKLFTIVTRHACSWFDFNIIKALIEEFGQANDRTRLAEYEQHFESYAKQRLPQELTHVEIGSKVGMTGCKKLVIKVDREWESISIGELERLCREFSKILGTDRKNLYLADINEGCIMLTLMVPKEMADTLSERKLTRAQKQLLASERVVRLNCAGLKWSRPSLSTARDDSSSESEEEMEVKRKPKINLTWFDLPSAAHFANDIDLTRSFYLESLYIRLRKRLVNHTSPYFTTCCGTPLLSSQIAGWLYDRKYSTERMHHYLAKDTEEEQKRKFRQDCILLSEAKVPNSILHLSGHYSHDSGRKYLLSPSMDHRFLELRNGKKDTYSKNAKPNKVLCIWNCEQW